MLSIQQYAYDLCDRCFGVVGSNPATNHVDGAVYYLICAQLLLPDYTAKRNQHLQQLQLIAYLSDEVFVEPS